MVIASLPGSSRPFGTLNSPLSSVTTVVAMVAPSFLTLTSPPSMTGSCAEVTFPVRTCACAPASAVSSAARLTPAANENCLSRMGYLPSELASLWHIRSHPDNAGAGLGPRRKCRGTGRKNPLGRPAEGVVRFSFVRPSLVERLDLHD